MDKSSSQVATILEQHHQEMLKEWVDEQLQTGEHRLDVITETELKQQSQEFLHLLREALLENDNVRDIDGQEWRELRELLDDISEVRASQGFTPAETASFIFSFKGVLLDWLTREIEDSNELARAIRDTTRLLDQVGLYITENFLQGREEIIQRQQQELIELSTPVVKMWEGILAVPLIGTLDSARTQIVMESLLQKIVETGSNVAIIDITGVPVVDTLVAQHLLKTVAAARLMGAECIISGIRPQIAQTIVHLGVDLHNVVTKASLSAAFSLALQRNGYEIQRKSEV